MCKSLLAADAEVLRRTARRPWRSEAATVSVADVYNTLLTNKNVPCMHSSLSNLVHTSKHGPVVFPIENTSYMAKRTSSLLEKAIFVSGRDTPSVNAFSDVLEHGESPMVQPGGVALVRDPVLSDSMFTDTEGTCWKQSEGAPLSRARTHVMNGCAFLFFRRTSRDSSLNT